MNLNRCLSIGGMLSGAEEIVPKMAILYDSTLHTWARDSISDRISVGYFDNTGGATLFVDLDAHLVHHFGFRAWRVVPGKVFAPRDRRCVYRCDVAL